ncbi:MAG: integrase [Marinobacter sp.]|uniref:integrase n=1 Tax=Marinobacter sp. TaxID=50741 RepID=UPI0032982BB9
MRLPAELSFLEDVLETPKLKYSKADWLLSDFPEPVWVYSFNYKNNKELNWDVELDDGSQLLSAEHADLLEGFKHWLIIATSAKRGNGSLTNSLKTQASAFNQVIRFVDYFLHNSYDYQLSKTGLAAITSDDLKLILDRIAAHSITNESLFDWSGNLSNYLINLVNSTDRNILDELLKTDPNLSVITPEQEEEQLLDIDLKDVPIIRAAIMHHGLYESRSRGLVPNSILLSKEIYRNTVRLKSEPKHSFDLLEIPREGHGNREFNMVPCSTREDVSQMSSTHFRYFKENLYSIGELHALNIPAPPVDSLIEIYNYQPNVKKLGRYQTLPSDLVFSAVRKAIEFHIEYGEDILNSYVDVARYCIQSNSSATRLEHEQIAELVSPGLRKLGVKKLGLTARSPGTLPTDSRSLAHKEHFNALRSNQGLVELVTVYYGAVQTVVGALMARRQGELCDLIAGNCLDESKGWLLFQNRKSTRGVFGLRQTEARPIEPIAVEMIEAIEKFQSNLIAVGALEKHTNLFAVPPGTGEIRLSYSGQCTHHRNFDAFCDYFETPLNDDNQRYYIRQHQLRRFFSMLFFYSSSFGGLETLQWMLGHTDRKHVWHYITETTDGPVLRGAKAQYITEYLYHKGDDNYKELACLLKAKFGTDDFHLVDSNEIEDYITSLLEEGNIEIEPEFFEDENGEQMRVIVKILDAA